MSLSDYLKRTKQTQAQLADKLGVTQQRVQQILKGEHPGLGLAIKIEDVTGIKVRSWVEKRRSK